MSVKKNTTKSKAINLPCFVLAFFLFASLHANAQSVIYDSISKQKVALIDVRKTYERIIEKGYGSAEMFEYLGNYYYKDRNFQKSKLYFDMLFKTYNLSQISKNSIELYKTL